MITIYTKKNCEKCAKVKKTLKEKNIEYEEKSVESAEDLSELIINGVDVSEAPIIKRDGKFFTNKNGLLRAIQ